MSVGVGVEDDLVEFVEEMGLEGAFGGVCV